ncbi:ankyrin repeat-containing domain [Cordyceps militaris]|uniref:Ankyrin repeat-containing domain n=1 Tax=Cordyceps militaris TaxID=73501 RepID=A0A2H4SMQ8_CORMI|nr:ankyrin repeat-containing domain [Cordyceps militaris]
MSFSISVGDLISGIDLCRKLRRSFANAPRQCQQIADQVRNLSIVLQDLEISASDSNLADTDLQELRQIAGGCHDVLLELSELVEKNLSLQEKAPGSKNIAKRAWAKVNWSPEIALSVQGRITANVTLLNAFQARMTRTATASLARYVESQEYQKILQWLSPAQYSREQADLIARRHPNTGQWLLDSPEFQRWLGTPGAIMFCPGIPGAGKTILAASVIDHVQTKANAGHGIGMAYIYFNFRRQQDQKLAHLLASLVKDLAQQDAFAIEAVKALFNVHEMNNTRPSTDELNKLLSVVIHSSSFQRIFIVVDALDECQTGENCRGNFASLLSSLVQGGKANVLATSRPIPEIRTALQHNSTITLEIRASDQDVHAYLDGNLDQLPSCIRLNLDLQDQIKSTIAKAADGMFLLARIYLSQLEDKLTTKTVKKTLSYFEEQGKKCADGETAKLEVLSQAYDQTLERIHMQRPGFRLLAEKALLWIVSARRPLKVMELLQALGIDEDESVFDDDNIPQLEDVVSACAGLVIVDEESNVVRLVHYTTQEYFEQRQDKWLPDAEWRMARACIMYLFTWENREWPSMASRTFFASETPAHRLHEYAAKHWGHHLASAPTSYQLSNVVLDFLQSTRDLNRCSEPLCWRLEILTETKERRGGKHALHFAAHFGLVETIKALLDHDGRLNSANVVDLANRTPIWYAIRSGKVDVVHELVRHGATVLGSASGEYPTPMAVAAYYGRYGLVKYLVENGAEVNEPYREWFFPRVTTALFAAAGRGHALTVKALLACDADIEFENKAGEASLFRAAASEHFKVVQCLINHGADVNASNRELTTPLMVACESGRVEIVGLLLASGADFEATDMRGKTAMRAAADSGVEAIVLALIDAGAKIEAREMWYNTPLQTPLLIACQAGHAHVARLLLSRGADVEAYRKFIHRYARYRDPQPSDLTPLLAAASEGHAGVVSVLLEYNADKEATNAEWQTPLMLAAAGGHYDVVKLLVESGVDLHGVDQEGLNAATFIWNAYSKNKTDQSSRRKADEATTGAKIMAKQHELLQIFAAAGATLITFEWEEVGSELWDDWTVWDDSGYPVGRCIITESILQVNML